MAGWPQPPQNQVQTTQQGLGGGATLQIDSNRYQQGSGNQTGGTYAGDPRSSQKQIDEYSKSFDIARARMADRDQGGPEAKAAYYAAQDRKIQGVSDPNSPLGQRILSGQTGPTQNQGNFHSRQLPSEINTYNKALANQQKQGQKSSLNSLSGATGY